ncbi:MAG: RNase J family beta-CASP ribonuclease [Oscillospiraceae bacterium]|nr:MAG: RNase J family beta-CASP ribonuclease [Oscillospiraceae bacterium]
MEQPEEEPAKSTQKPASKSRSGSKSGKKTSSAKQQSGKEEKTAQTAAPKSEKRRGRPRKKSVAEESQPVVPAPVQVSAPAQPAARKSGRRTRQKEDALASVRIIPLGGLGEIGKNMTVIETPQDIVIIDCGLAFPDDDMPGIDLVIPDFSYVVQNRDKVRGIFLTHGHEDHIGGLSYLLKELNIPVYAARLTIGLVEGKLKEAGNLKTAKLNIIKAGDTIRCGSISVEAIAVNHSIPDACAFAIFTPAGTLVHTGDFKIDYTPVDGQMIDLARFGELGRHGVLALMSDSTNAERPGMTPSERRVGEAFEMLFNKAGDRRIIVASFSSNVHRIQQIINVAVRHGRKIVVSGRSMENVTAKAMELGYLKAPKDAVLDVDHMKGIPDEKMVVITTGSQGEPMSALTRMARGEHRKLSVTSHDFIIISANPIPGNEKLVGKVINDLMKLGADVIYESSMGIHVSGHACREEIRTILGLTKPRFFIPVHGEYKHLAKNRDLAREMGIQDDRIMVAENGQVIELTAESMKSVTSVVSGAVMVDGSGIGDVGSIVLRDRRMLSEEGLIIAVATIDSKTGAILAGPDVVSRGFVYVRESEELLVGARQVCRQALAAAGNGQGGREWSNLKQAVRDQLGSYLFNKTKRRPIILPIIQEV